MDKGCCLGFYCKSGPQKASFWVGFFFSFNPRIKGKMLDGITDSMDRV